MAGPRRKVVQWRRYMYPMGTNNGDATLECGHVVIASSRRGEAPKSSQCFKCERRSRGLYEWRVSSLGEYGGPLGNVWASNLEDAIAVAEREWGLRGQLAAQELP